MLHLSQKNEARRLITLLNALFEAHCKLIIRAEAGPDELFFPETQATSKSSTGTGTKADVNDGGDAVYPEIISEIYQDQTSPFRPSISSYTYKRKAGFDPDKDSDFGPIQGKDNEIGLQVDFGMTSSFTGEDERFAYKRGAGYGRCAVQDGIPDLTLDGGDLCQSKSGNGSVRLLRVHKFQSNLGLRREMRSLENRLSWINLWDSRGKS